MNIVTWSRFGRVAVFLLILGAALPACSDAEEGDGSGGSNDGGSFGIGDGASDNGPTDSGASDGAPSGAVDGEDGGPDGATSEDPSGEDSSGEDGAGEDAVGEDAAGDGTVGEDVASEDGGGDAEADSPDADAQDTGTGDIAVTCEADPDCAFGEEWCVDGVCTECDNSGLTCRISCPIGWGVYERNGCHPCECGPPNECTSDEDCTTEDGAGECYAGEECWEGCAEGDPACCLGNVCSLPGCVEEPRTGCTVRGCPEGLVCRVGVEFGCAPATCGCSEEGLWVCDRGCAGGTCHTPCTTDADCTFGEQWCVDGACTECDNSGLSCRIDCPDGWGLYERNGCNPCECAPPNECVVDGDCPEPAEGEAHCYPGRFCTDWCAPGDPSCCHGNICSMAGCPVNLEQPNIACWTRGCAEGETCIAEGCASSDCHCQDLGEGPLWLCNADCVFASCSSE